MKDYLNSTEKANIIAALKVSTMFEDFLKGNLFTKEEKTNLKKSITFIGKAIIGKVDKKGNPIEGDKEGVLKRLNKTALTSFNNSLKNTQFFVSDKYEIDSYKKRISSDIKDAYEANKDFFRLVELILYKNCKNCNKCGSKCEFYQEFENKGVPEFDGVKHGENCKYAYKEDDLYVSGGSGQVLQDIRGNNKASSKEYQRETRPRAKKRKTGKKNRK